MKDKIFQLLKQAYKSLGLGDEVLMAHAEMLANTGIVTEDNVSIVVDSQKSFLESLQKENDRRVTDAKKKFEAEQTAKEEAEKKPLLGICLGMQLLFEKSYEYGEHAGLGFIKGEVCPLGPDLADKGLKVPQMGWNALHIVKDDPLFRYIREGEYVYYVHSNYGKSCAESTLAVSDYSIPVTGAVRAGRVYGTQFHPEKSGDTGLRILKAFSEL